MVDFQYVNFLLKFEKGANQAGSALSAVSKRRSLVTAFGKKSITIRSAPDGASFFNRQSSSLHPAAQHKIKS